MESVFALWLPILVSALVVFFASLLVWMVLPHHKADIKKLPNEDKFTEFIKSTDIPAGTYFYPGCGDAAEMKSSEYAARYEKGPWGNINVQSCKPNFGMNLLLTFIFYLVVSLFVAYVTKEARPAGAEFLPVFQVAGATALLAYCAGSIPGAIFFGKPRRFAVTEFLDGVAYGLLTGLTFAVLWPAANLPNIG